MNRDFCAPLLAIIALSGCTSMWTIDGSFVESHETLTGEATRYMDGGTFELYGSGGAHCTGAFTAVSDVEGRGRILCDDRRSGSFMLNTQRKMGHGDLGGHGFTFTLRNPRKDRR